MSQTVQSYHVDKQICKHRNTHPRTDATENNPHRYPLESTPPPEITFLPKILPGGNRPTLVYKLVLGSGIWVSVSFQIILAPWVG